MDFAICGEEKKITLKWFVDTHHIGIGIKEGCIYVNKYVTFICLKQDLVQLVYRHNFIMFGVWHERANIKQNTENSDIRALEWSRRRKLWPL